VNRRHLEFLGIVALLGAAMCCGCQLPGPPQRSAAPIAPPRAGEVFLVRGLFGIFSTGMDELQKTLAEQGVRAVALQHTDGPSAGQWIIGHYHPSDGPIILIGHSLGANEVVGIATKLHHAHVPVDLMITLDPVAVLSVPPNVRRAINYYRPAGIFGPVPILRGMALKKAPNSEGVLCNIDLNDYPELDETGGNHFTLDKSPTIQKLIVNQIVRTCPLDQESPRAIGATVSSTPGGR
jgi:hypothetical protein